MQKTDVLLVVNAAEMCTLLLASVLGQDVAVCLEKNIFIQRLPPHAQSVARPVTTLALSFCLFCLPRFSNARRFQRTHALREMGQRAEGY